MTQIWNKLTDKEWTNAVPVCPVHNPDNVIPAGDCRVTEPQKRLFKAVELNE